MTKPAAISAQLVDMRNVGSHKSLRLTLHVPEELALRAIEAFGWPTGANPVPVALARLQQAVGEARTDSPAKEAGLHSQESAAPSSRLVRQAGMACKDPRFWKFLTDNDKPVTNENEAAVVVRLICHVRSRKEFIPGTPNGDRWENFYGHYLAWLDAPEFAA